MNLAIVEKTRLENTLDCCRNCDQETFTISAGLSVLVKLKYFILFYLIVICQNAKQLLFKLS